MLQLTALGFCGVDDSVHIDQLLLLVQAFPNVEFGVLFRPDKEGTSRYASSAWVESLTSRMAIFTQETGIAIKLAAHLCGSRVNELLQGDTVFLETIVVPAFGRVQINATAVNGVDTSHLNEFSTHTTLYAIMEKFPQIEFILQKNHETAALCQGIESLLQEAAILLSSSSSSSSSSRRLLSNVAMLCDESKGTGVLSSSWPAPTSTLYQMGYAGGIGPDNVTEVLKDICEVRNNNGSFWIDMESSLRSVKNGKDIFDLDKCYTVIDAVCTFGLMTKPPFLR